MSTSTPTSRDNFENPEKLKENYQCRWRDKHIFDEGVRRRIDEKVHLHKEIENVRSSAAACLNVLGTMSQNSQDLIVFLKRFGMVVDEIIPFPNGAEIGGEIYNDEGNVVFEWIGPKVSPINERGGKRGQYRTSIDAFILARIDGKMTQVLIEWKFTETYSNAAHLHKFGGVYGSERLRRYSTVLALLRKQDNFPFQMEKEDSWGLADLGYEPLYQLLRMTLLAKTTTSLRVSRNVEIEDYAVLHLSHSANNALNIVSERHLRFCPGLSDSAEKSLHEVWQSDILKPDEARKFKHGYWNEHLDVVSDTRLGKYLVERYQ